MGPQFIIKRNGKREPYDSGRVRRALKRAFDAASHPAGTEILDNLTVNIGEEAAALPSAPGLKTSPGVEEIQDLVERSLMSAGYFSVARGYILYREEHRRLREERQAEILRRADVGELNLIKRNGETMPLSLEKIQQSLERAAWDRPGELDLDSVMEQVLKEGYSGMSTRELERGLIQSAAGFIEKDPGYDILASRLFVQSLYKDVMGESVNALNLTELYRNSFQSGIKEGLDRNVFDRRLGDFDLERLAGALDPDRDELLRYIGLQTLSERYLVRIDGRCIETPQAFWMRTAMGLAINEENREDRAIEFYRLYSSLRFISSTPTLFHSGLTHPQLSSCYVSKIEDDLNHIFKVFGDNAQLAKWSGGIGNDWTAVRATGAAIGSTRVESQGVIPFLKIANDTTVAINRSGKRRGATVAYLECWHRDYEDFLDLKRNTGDDRRRTHDMNTASWIPDLFMKRVEEQGDWTLFSPDDVPDLHELYGRDFEDRYRFYETEARAGRLGSAKTLKAAELWRKMLTRLFETGHPWITFKDPCNIRSPQDHAGVIHNSNLCTEITLNNSAEETAVCNLGSVNLARHVGPEGLDEELLADTIATAMRMLDNVVDLNFYPTEEARTSNLRHRPVALGMMGLQDALFIRRFPFDSEEAAEFVDRTAEIFSYHAILNSSRLAVERGRYESYAGSKWDRGIFPLDTLDLLEKERGRPVEVNRESRLDWSGLRRQVAENGMRNSNTMAIAPTATISNIAGCMPCIEPIYKNLYVKANMSGEFTVVNTRLVNDLKAAGLWGPDMLNELKFRDGDISGIPGIPEELKNLYKEAFDLDPGVMVNLTALRGKWIDQSQSHNVFMKGASGRKLDEIYLRAWKSGLKTTYYLRTLAASQIEKSTLDAGTYGYTQKRSRENRETENKPTAPPETVIPLPDSVSAAASESKAAEVATATPSARERRSPSPDNGALPKALAALIGASAEESGPADRELAEASPETHQTRTGETDPVTGIPASQVGQICSLYDPDCEACQ